MLKINFKIAEICPTMAIDSIIATATKMYPNIFLVAISGFILRLRITVTGLRCARKNSTSLSPEH